MNFYESAVDIQDEIISIRRELHQNPELGFQEFETAKLVAEKLTEYGLTVETGVGGTGVIGLLEGQHPGKTIALRADMDALPIIEQTGLEFSSSNHGVMHACGHDLHTSSLIGVARTLSDMRDQLHGNIKFIFQPAEETMGGAKRMIDEGVLENPKVDAIICLHTWPELPAGTIGLRKGAIMAASDFFSIKILGKGGHAAHPHKSIDPIPIAGQVIAALQTIVSRDVAPTDSAVVTIGQIHGGSASNIIAPTVELSGTVRSISPETRKNILDKIESIATNITSTFGASAELEINHASPSLINNDDLVELLDRTASEVIGSDKVFYLDQPSLGGEDFAYYLEKVPGMLFRLGTANESDASKLPLHNPSVIFDENSLVTSMSVMSALAVECLNAAKKESLIPN